MEQNPQQTLEELIHRELIKLPDRPALATLIPGVLAQIHARSCKRWWQRPWPQWPWCAQVASLPLMLASAAAAIFGVSVLWDFVMGSSDFGLVWDKWDSISAALEVVTVLGNAVWVLGRAVGQGWLLLALFIPVVMYLACVGLGTLCYQMASSRR